MFEYILKIDREITLMINGFSSEYVDYLMIFLSNKYVWIPLYVFLIYFLFKFDKNNSFKLIAICISTVIISDFITSSVMKPFFERLRPCNSEELLGLIDIVSGCGKKYSFASSHSSTTFSLATIYYYLSKRKFKFLFFWSLAIGYSRVYLGVHYFGDVAVGLLVGFLTSLIIYRITKKYIS